LQEWIMNGSKANMYDEEMVGNDCGKMVQSSPTFDTSTIY